MTPATTERSVVEVLRAARERISDPERWHQYGLSVGPQDQPVHPNSPAACRWCVLGSIYAECGVCGWENGLHEEVEEYLDRVAHRDFARAPSEINDHIGHDATLRLLDTTIEVAEAEA